MAAFGVFEAVLAGLLSSILRQSAWSPDLPFRDDLWTGCLTWVLLSAGCFIHSYRQNDRIRVSPSVRKSEKVLWSQPLKIAALSAAGVISQISRSRGVLPYAIPCVTLITIIILTIFPVRKDERHRLTPRDYNPRKNGSVDATDSPLRVPLLTALNLVIALIFGVFMPYHPLLHDTVATDTVLFVGAQVAVFTLLPRLSKTNESRHLRLESRLDWDLFQRLSLISFGYYGCILLYSTSVSLVVFPTPSILLRASCEAAWWISLITLCYESRSPVATTFDTVSQSFNLFAISEGVISSVLLFASSMGALWQSVSSIPQSRKSRNWLYLLVLIPLLTWQHDRHADLGQQDLQVGVHPVASIVYHAQVEFSLLQRKQSRNLAQATREYTRRYGREPPPKFDQWFKLALKNKFVLIDEFDSLMKTLEPFWGLGPMVLRNLSTQTQERFPDSFAKYEVRRGRVIITRGEKAAWFRASMTRMLPAEWAYLLPNMSLTLNVFDEPRVSVPRSVLDQGFFQAQSVLHGRKLSPNSDTPNAIPALIFYDLGKQNAWNEMTMSCPSESPAQKHPCVSPAVEDYPAFVQNVAESRDICNHCELQNLEGFMMNPATLHLTHAPAPVWSQGKPSSFNDILLPSPYYLARDDDYNETHDTSWEAKASKLYWVGAATGGHATEDNWKHMQRQRLVLMTQTNANSSIRLLHDDDQPGIWTPYETKMSEIASLFSTRIVGVTSQCESFACEAQKDAFGIGDHEIEDPYSTAYAHKLLFDLDGNGFSGRFYRLLRSRSAVLKQTIFEEWHDDRIIPWVHYIPVSTGFDELPELVRFLATTESGERIAAKVAQDGRVWADKSLRNVDMQLVWLRMLLEYARIIDLDRDVS